MRILACSLLLIACSDDTLKRTCPYYCYWGSDKTKDVGACHGGISVCDENFNEIACEGQVIPVYETCNGIDDDCDGYVDEYPDTNLRRTINCSGLGVCENYYRWTCEDGVEGCEYTHYQYQEEETYCDGLDNDCDGEIDEVFKDLPLSERVCYTGNPIESFQYPPCRNGLFECVSGEVICRGEVTPEPEVCDGIDNDCDGEPDDNLVGQTHKYDIVFVVDISGSMGIYIDAVRAALQTYASQFNGDPNFQFALIVLGDPSIERPYMSKRLDLSDFATFNTAMSALSLMGAWEPSYDALLWTCDRANNPFEISWRPDALPIVFMFVDEDAQSYTIPQTNGTDITAECSASGTPLWIWSRNAYDYAWIAQLTNGGHFNITSNMTQILADLNSIVMSWC
jgi:hypothetical protein